MKKNESCIFNTADCFIISILALLSVATRFWLQAWPDFVVFDEVHFGEFTNCYLKREYFFDIHPPLAKLIIAGISKLSGYKGEINFEFDCKFDSTYYVTLRMIPELFSSFVPSLIYATMRLMNFNYFPSLVSSCFVLFETSLICESRFLLTDGILHFFVILHMMTLLYSIRFPSFFNFFINGLTLGAACSCKVTAWGLPFVDAIFNIYSILKIYEFRLKKNLENIIYEIVYRGFFLYILLIGFYFTSFAIHIIILSNDGPGSAFLEKSIANTLSKTSYNSDTINEIEKSNLINSVEPKNLLLNGPSFFYRIISLNLEMHFANMKIDSFHSYESSPISWPLLTSCCVVFSLNPDIYCIGNVFVYYFSFVAILILFSCSFLRWQFFAITFSYIIHYLPFFFVSRCMFLYHYQIPLMFATMAAGASLSLIKHKKIQIMLSIILIVFSIIGFLLWSPFVYGTYCENLNKRIWTDNWFFGDKSHRLKLQQSEK